MNTDGFIDDLNKLRAFYEIATYAVERDLLARIKEVAELHAIHGPDQHYMGCRELHTRGRAVSLESCGVCTTGAAGLGEVIRDDDLQISFRPVTRETCENCREFG